MLFVGILSYYIVSYVHSTFLSIQCILCT